LISFFVLTFSVALPFEVLSQLKLVFGVMHGVALSPHFIDSAVVG